MQARTIWLVTLQQQTWELQACTTTGLITRVFALTHDENFWLKTAMLHPYVGGGRVTHV